MFAIYTTRVSRFSGTAFYVMEPTTLGQRRESRRKHIAHTSRACESAKEREERLSRRHAMEHRHVTERTATETAEQREERLQRLRLLQLTESKGTARF